LCRPFKSDQLWLATTRRPLAPRYPDVIEFRLHLCDAFELDIEIGAALLNGRLEPLKVAEADGSLPACDRLGPLWIAHLLKGTTTGYAHP
jgi:hypothetical protein